MPDLSARGKEGAAGAVRRPLRPAIADRGGAHAAQSARGPAQRRGRAVRRCGAAACVGRHRRRLGAGLSCSQIATREGARARWRAKVPALADRLSWRVEELDQRRARRRFRRRDRNPPWDKIEVDEITWFESNESRFAGLAKVKKSELRKTIDREKKSGSIIWA